MHDIERIADRFGFINKGELLTVRSPRELAAERADDMLVRYHASLPIGEPLRVLREGEVECAVLHADLPAFIAQLNQPGGHLLTVKPAVSLETVFFNILDGAARKTTAWRRERHAHRSCRFPPLPKFAGTPSLARLLQS